MSTSKASANDWNCSNKRNTIRLGYATLVWVLTTAVAAVWPRIHLELCDMADDYRGVD